ncbi:MAG TPA: hypothetical protein PKD85_11040 [Saprospiraceae bacterium]|nr:hypothetical protein [Saprospiraceae bacterium]
MAKLKIESPMIIDYQSEPLLNPMTQRKFETNTTIEVSPKKKQDWIKKAVDTGVLKLKERVVLSAASTKVKDKGWVEVVSCRHVFPTNPSFEFLNDRSDKFGGIIYFYLENVKPNSKLQFTIRMSGYTGGGASIRIGCSTPTRYSLTPITISGSMNLVLGNIMHIPSNPPGNLALITIEVQFNTSYADSWSLRDCVVEEIE